MVDLPFFFCVESCRVLTTKYYHLRGFRVKHAVSARGVFGGRANLCAVRVAGGAFAGGGGTQRPEPKLGRLRVGASAPMKWASLMAFVAAANLGFPRAALETPFAAPAGNSGNPTKEVAVAFSPRARSAVPQAARAFDEGINEALGGVRVAARWRARRRLAIIRPRCLLK